MSNIYDSAYELQKTLGESEEFLELKQAFENVMGDPDAKQKFDEFRDTQMALQDKQANGEDITEEEVQRAQQIVEEVQQHEDIANLMEKEQHLNQVINDVSKIIMEPLESLYGTGANEEG